MDPVAIKRPVQLLVEGKDPLNFLDARESEVAGQRPEWNFDHDAFVGVRRFLGDLAAGRPAE